MDLLDAGSALRPALLHKAADPTIPTGRQNRSIAIFVKRAKMEIMAKDTRARMLETTARLLQHRGYHGTSLSDILEESAAPRGSLYFHFPAAKTKS